MQVQLSSGNDKTLEYVISLERGMHRGELVSSCIKGEWSNMLWAIAVILIILWLLGVVTANTMGGFIHVLLIIAIIVVLVRVIQGKKLL
jgi:hypothetical protein